MGELSMHRLPRTQRIHRPHHNRCLRTCTVQFLDEELIGQHGLIQVIAFINSAKDQLTGTSIAVK